MWSDHKVVRRCGCGPVAAYDLLLYLEKKHGKDFSFPLTRQEYIRGLEKLQRRYFPLLYPRGINGLLLTFGLNRMFLERRLPYVAVWAASGRKLFARMADMLRHDIPVVLSVGPNFPLVWQKNRLVFYRLASDGRFLPAADVSWGRSYYIRIDEYEDYVNRYSNFLFSNLVLIRQKERN